MTSENQEKNREWLVKMADAEDTCRSISVGGIAVDLLGAQAMANEAANNGDTKDDVLKIKSPITGEA
jgi:hypothetical protein